MKGSLVFGALALADAKSWKKKPWSKKPKEKLKNIIFYINKNDHIRKNQILKHESSNFKTLLLN